MKFSELKGDTYIKNWLSGIRAKPNTREIYTDSMRAYTEFIGRTPEELITQAEEEILSGTLMRKRKIVSDLRDFTEFLDESGIAPMSVKGRLTGVRSFYKYYDIQMPTLPRSSVTRPQMKHREIPSKEDIQDVISICDPLEKAIVLTGVSSASIPN